MLVVDCVLFDLDGTLYTSAEYSDRLEYEIVRYVSSRLQLPERDCKRLLSERRQSLGTLTRTLASLHMGREDFFREMAERMEPSQYLKRDPRIRAMLRTLREHGFSLALVSNSGRPLVIKILEALGLDGELFDTIVTSSEAEPKPSHASFQMAMHKLGCVPDHTAYVGDRIESELRPAHELGIRTILIGSERQSSPYVDIVLEKVTDVPKVIQRDLV